MFTDFLDALPQIEVEGDRGLQDVQGVQAEVTAEGNGAPRRSNRLRVRTLARGGSLQFPPTNFPVQPVLSRAYRQIKPADCNVSLIMIAYVC